MYFLSARGQKIENSKLSYFKDNNLYGLLNMITVSEIKFRALLIHRKITQQAQRGLEVKELSHRVSRAHFRYCNAEIISQASG